MEFAFILLKPITVPRFRDNIGVFLNLYGWSSACSKLSDLNMKSTDKV